MAIKSSSVCALEPEKITKTKWIQYYGTPCSSMEWMAWVKKIGRCVSIVGRQQCYLFYFVKVYILYVLQIFRNPEEEWLRGFPKLRLCHGLPSLQLPARALPRGLGPLPLPQQDGRGGCTLSAERPPASDPITVKNWALRISITDLFMWSPSTYAYDINILNECETEDISIVCTILTYLQ